MKILCGIEWASEVKRNYSKINVISRNFLLVEFSIIFSKKCMWNKIIEILSSLPEEN